MAWSWGRQNVGAGDEIIVTEMEHHANIVPWQMLCEEQGARLRVLPIREDGELDLDALPALFSARTRLLAVSHVSNVLGTINPVRELVALAHARGVPVLVDGAQAAPRIPVDVRALGCDFYAVSGHKLYGPSGIGALYARAELLEAMPPWQGGGSMIESVSFDKTTYAGVPTRFEAGSPNAEGAIGLGAAIDWLGVVGMERIAAHEGELLAYGTQLLDAIPGVRIYGRARAKTGVLSFTIAGVHAHDVGTVLDRRRRRHPRGPPLRSAADGALRRRRDGARLARRLQRTRRPRPPGARRAQGRRALRLGTHGGSARALPDDDPRPQQAAAELPRAGRRQPRGRRPQPALRRPRHRARAARRRRT